MKSKIKISYQRFNIFFSVGNLKNQIEVRFSFHEFHYRFPILVDLSSLVDLI